ncbi:MAG: acetyl-CoA carboxylase biotin carboxyl carrier protein subunit [Dehalococcoidia bacterium]|nr:MAG: acetyl-CoA carboxylase biotin carboxyl carrier protein subunit [Dehalococcoidia bacterium]
MAQEIVESPMPGIIKSVCVAVGDQVNENDTLCILEAMKMETPLVAPMTGKISEINVSEGQSVKGGEKLFVIES